MRIHQMVSSSGVNGPGCRAVIWFQGCTLACPGCWNPGTHAFGITPDRAVSDVGDWILGCPDIEGATFSGGEPFQQAQALLELCEYLKGRRPALSLALFSGYTIRELIAGRWQYRIDGSDQWHRGTKQLFDLVKAHLDFGVFGRFSQGLVTTEKPLCGSRNQEVVFFSTRYSSQDLEPQCCEINISEDGEAMTVTGFPPPDLLRALTRQ